MQIAIVATRRGSLDLAREMLATALRDAIAIGRPSLLLTGVAVFADLLEAQGEEERARQVLAFAAAHPAMNATERDDLRARLAARPATPPPWPGMELSELAHRIVAERDLAHAPLIAALAAIRGTPGERPPA
jgi:hypothetical protein